MNANELLDIIGDSRNEYIMEAQRHRGGSAVKRRTPIKRVLLIAAVLAMLVALVGFAAIVLNLDSLILGNYASENYTGETQEMTLLSMQGYSGTVNYLASKEWYEFDQGYDPDGSLLKQADAANYWAPPAYDAYLCYTDEMVAKVDEICEKYDLQLLGPVHICDSPWPVFDALGIQSIVDHEAAELQGADGYYYEDGTFQVSGDLLLRGEDVPWKYPVEFQYRCVKKTSFDSVFINVWADVEYEQWEYTNAKGNKLLLVLSEENALLFADKGDAFVTVSISSTRVGDAVLGEQQMDPAAMEAIADVLLLDYEASLQPAPPQTEISLYSDYADYIHDLLERGAVLTYALAQVDGINDEELIIMDGSGIIQEVLFIRDGFVQTMASGGNLYLCDYRALNPIMDATDPDYRYIYRVIEQVSDVGGGVQQHQFMYINEAAQGVILDVLMECADGTYARSDNGGAAAFNWETITQEEYNAIMGQYERLPMDRVYIGEFFGEHTPDYTLFDTVYLPIASGEVKTDWESLQAFITERGYECRMGEGSFSVTDPENPDSLLYGDLTTENGIIEAANVSYQLVLGDASRTVRTQLTENRVEHLVNVSFFRAGVPVDSLEELEIFIKGIL